MISSHLNILQLWTQRLHHRQWPVSRQMLSSPCRKYKQPSDTAGSGRGFVKSQRMRVFMEALIPVLRATPATIRLTFQLPLSFKAIVNVLKIALAKICLSSSFECYLVK